MRISFILFLLVVSGQSYCQSFLSGFVIKSNGDSSKVLIKETLPSQSLEKCVVKEDGRINRYYAKDLSAYGYFGGSRFEVLEIKDRKFFVKVLVKGTLSLYQKGRTFYVKENEVIVLSNSKNQSNNYIETLNSIFENCNLTANKIAYSSKELTSIVQNYNRCKGGAGSIFKERLAKTAFGFTAKIGYASNSVSALSNDGYESNSISKTIPVDLGVDFSLPRVYRNLFITLNLKFEHNDYQFYDERKKFSSLVRRDVILNLTSMKIPIGVRYTIFKQNTTPFISGGIVPTLFLNKKQHVIEESENSNTITTKTSNDVSSVSQKGFWVGIGYIKPLPEHKLSLIFEAKYESQHGSIGGDLNFNTTLSGLSLLIGIRY